MKIELKEKIKKGNETLTTIEIKDSLKSGDAFDFLVLYENVLFQIKKDKLLDKKFYVDFSKILVKQHPIFEDAPDNIFSILSLKDSRKLMSLLFEKAQYFWAEASSVDDLVYKEDVYSGKK